jgi:hypothetical protein
MEKLTGAKNPLAIWKNPLAIPNNPLAIWNNPLAIANNQLAIWNNPLAIANNQLAIWNNPLAIANNPLAIWKNPLAIWKNPLAIAKNPLAIWNNPLAIWKTYCDVRTVNVSGSNAAVTIAGNIISNGVLQVQVYRATLVSVNDASGKLLFVKQFTPGLQSIDVSRYSKGIYLLKTKDDTQKIMVQ